MSAWYNLSVLGFYPVNPANGEFVFGSPQVENAVIHLPDGGKFEIFAKNHSTRNSFNETRYLNGEKIAEPNIRY